MGAGEKWTWEAREGRSCKEWEGSGHGQVKQSGQPSQEENSGVIGGLSKVRTSNFEEEKKSNVCLYT